MTNRTPNDYFTVFILLDADNRQTVTNNAMTSNSAMSVSVLNSNTNTETGTNTSDTQAWNYNLFLRRIRDLARTRQNDTRQNDRVHTLAYVLLADLLVNGSSFSIEFNRQDGDIVSFWENLFGVVKKKIISKKDLKKLKAFRISKQSKKIECSICMNTLKYRELVRELPCEHTFHSKCVDRWLLRHCDSCPVCRKPVLNEECHT